MALNQTSRRLLFFLLLFIAFLFRLLFGLCQFQDDDTKQIYLIGLKFYTTGSWPYFGPDVTSTIQIPGALQGLLVGLPFYLLPIPEAPYLLVNILTFAGLCFFAWYCGKRLPQIPKWFVWSWLLTTAWTMALSTQTQNLSYVLPAAIFFFIGAIETYPFLTRNIIPQRRANFMMGFALLWIMQLHLSWVVLAPYVALSLYFQFRESRRTGLAAVAWFSIGAILPASLLLPTLLKYGLANGLGDTNQAVQFNSGNLRASVNFVEGILGRFLSFASFELPRLIGRDSATRLSFMKEHRWLVPLVLFLTVGGILQSIALLLLWFRKKHSQPDWQAVKYFTLSTVVLLYVFFMFSMKPPLSGTFYVVAPIALLYGLYCWNEPLQKTRWQKFAAVFIICSVVFEVGLALHNYSRVSLYVERDKIVEAIKTKNYHLVGERRPGTRY